MTWIVVGVAALALAALAAFLPQSFAPASGPMTSSARAAWVARLLGLAEQAEKSGDADVASAARALVSAIVAKKKAEK